MPSNNHSFSERLLSLLFGPRSMEDELAASGSARLPRLIRGLIDGVSFCWILLFALWLLARTGWPPVLAAAMDAISLTMIAISGLIITAMREGLILLYKKREKI